jgi:hypothetical protein
MTDTAKIVARTLRRKKERTEDTRGENEFGYLEQKYADSDITRNCGHRWGIVCLFHRLAEGI